MKGVFGCRFESCVGFMGVCGKPSTGFDGLYVVKRRAEAAVCFARCIAAGCARTDEA